MGGEREKGTRAREKGKRGQKTKKGDFSRVGGRREGKRKGVTSKVGVERKGEAKKGRKKKCIRKANRGLM